MKQALLIALCALASIGFAQDKTDVGKKDDKTPPISPDRPDLTNGPGITPTGKIVFETGYRQTRTSGFTLHEWGDGPTIRYGLNDRFEVRFVAPTYAVDSAGNKGWEDMDLGFKWLLVDGGDGGGFRKPSYALQAGSTLASGSTAFRSKQILPSFTGIVDWDFGDNGDLGGNFGGTEQLNGLGRGFILWAASLSYNHTIRGPLAGYFEGYMLIPDSGNGPTNHFVDGGFQYLLNNDCMLDASVGTQVDLHRQSSYFDLGFSFRF